MSIDEQLRQGLEAITDHSLDVVADCSTVRQSAQRRQRRRRTISITTIATVVVVAGVASLILTREQASSPHIAVPASNGTSPSATTPAPPVTSNSGSIPQDLTFTGRYAGHIATADPANSGEVLGPHSGPDPRLPPACTSSLPTQTGSEGAVIGIVATLNGQRLLFSYTVGNINDPTHSLNEATAQFGNDKTFGPSSPNNLTFDPTRVIVDADRNGAQVDSDLYYYEAGDQVVGGHVNGHFRCAP
jgi:hypothetical protein